MHFIASSFKVLVSFGMINVGHHFLAKVVSLDA